MGIAAALTKLAPQYVSSERKSGYYRRETSGGRSRLPLVGGPALLVGMAVVGIAAESSHTLICLLAASGYFAGGLLDDLLKSRRGQGRSEIASLLFAAIGAGLSATVLLMVQRPTTVLAMANWVDQPVVLWAWYFALSLALTLGTGFSDGIDGLTAGLVLLTLLVLTLAGDDPLQSPALLLAAATFGFLLLNLPSRGGRRRLAIAYLGDSGALLLGGLLVPVAVITGFDLLLPLAAAMIVFEGASALLQAKLLVPLYRRSARLGGPDHATRPHNEFPLPFIATPLHHHLDLCGLGRFGAVLALWAGQLAFGALALAVVVSDGSAGLWMALGAVLALAAWLAISSLRPAQILIAEPEMGKFTVTLVHGRFRWLRVRGGQLTFDGPPPAIARQASGRPLNPLETQHIWSALAAGDKE